MHLQLQQPVLRDRVDAAGTEDTNGAGQVDVRFADSEYVVVNVIDKLLSPHLRVSFAAAFKQSQNDSSLESTRNISRMQPTAYLLRKLRQDFLRFKNPDTSANTREIVWLDKRNCVYSRTRLALQAIGQALEEFAAMIKQSRRIAL
jgi:hypothetical protein